MRDYRKLQVWAKAHALTLEIYSATARFPVEERYGLTSQVRRSCASVAANIAEGSGRDSDAEFARSLQIARGSAVELENHLLLAHDLGYLDDPAMSRLMPAVIEVKKMLCGLLGRL